MTIVGDVLAVFNAGSTSLKFGAYAPTSGGSPNLLCRGRIDSMQGDPHFAVTRPNGAPWATHAWGDGHSLDHAAALQFVITALEANLSGAKVMGAGPASCWAASATRRRSGSTPMCSIISRVWWRWSHLTRRPI